MLRDDFVCAYDFHEEILYSTPLNFAGINLFTSGYLSILHENCLLLAMKWIKARFKLLLIAGIVFIFGILLHRKLFGASRVVESEKYIALLKQDLARAKLKAQTENPVVLNFKVSVTFSYLRRFCLLHINDWNSLTFFMLTHGLTLGYSI